MGWVCFKLAETAEKAALVLARLFIRFALFS